MRWRSEAGQATVEFATVIPLVALLLVLIMAAGYGTAAQLVVIASASQGARLGAAACTEQVEPPAVLSAAEEKALAMMAPLSGPKEATAALDGVDLVVTSSFTFMPLLPGTGEEAPGGFLIGHTARYYCGLPVNPGQQQP